MRVWIEENLTIDEEENESLIFCFIEADLGFEVDSLKYL